jgi:hypothetical protein
MENLFVSEQEKTNLELVLDDTKSLEDLECFIFNRANALRAEVKTKMLVVDYSESLTQMLNWPFWGEVHFGKPDSGQLLIPDGLYKRRQIIKTKVFHFDRVLDSTEVIQEMLDQGYRPATLYELLTFGKRALSYIEHFDVISLATFRLMHDDDVYMSKLTQEGKEFPTVSLICFNGNWSRICRFLGVRI